MQLCILQDVLTFLRNEPRLGLGFLCSHIFIIIIFHLLFFLSLRVVMPRHVTPGPSTHVGISSSASAGESPFNTAHNPYSPNGAFTVAESVTLPRKPFLLSHSRPPVPGERTSRWAAANGLVNDPLQQQQHQQGMLSYQQASNTGPMMIEHYPPTHQREQQQLQHQQHSYYGQSHNTLPSIQRQGQDRNAYAIGGAGGEYHEDARYAASAPPPLHQQLIQHFSPQQEQHSQQHQQQYPQRNAQSSHNQHHAPSRQSTTTSSSASTFSSPDNSGGFAGAGNTVSMANVGGYGYSNYGYGYGSTTSGTISGAGSAYAEASMSGSTAGRGRGETG